MGKFDGYLLCSDFDGTFTDDHRAISRENADAVRYFQSEGGLFTVATGRYPHYAKEFGDVFVPNTYVVADNGALVYDLVKDKPVFSCPIKADIISTTEFIYNNIPSVCSMNICGAVTDNTNLLFKDGFWEGKAGSIPQEYIEWYKGVPRVKETGDIRRYISENSEDPYKIVLVQDEEHTMANYRFLSEHFKGKYNVMVSWNEGIELLDAEAGKGEMILKMKHKLEAVHTTVGVGDNINDLSMIKLCDIGYAVSNAAAELKALADRITVSNNESAIARIVEDIAAGRQ